MNTANPQPFGVHVKPSSLEFTTSLFSNTITLYNPHDYCISYELRSNATDWYSVRPSKGRIVPQSTLSVEIRLKKAKRNAPVPQSLQHQFMVIYQCNEPKQLATKKITSTVVASSPTSQQQQFAVQKPTNDVSANEDLSSSFSSDISEGSIAGGESEERSVSALKEEINQQKQKLQQPQPQPARRPLKGILKAAKEEILDPIERDQMEYEAQQAKDRKKPSKAFSIFDYAPLFIGVIVLTIVILFSKDTTPESRKLAIFAFLIGLATMYIQTTISAEQTKHMQKTKQRRSK